MTLAPANTTPANQTDAELISLSRTGDRRAFGLLVRRYQAMISGLVYAACGDLHRSEDVAQDTFIAAWKSLSGLRDAARLPGWLCQIARRRLADRSRSASSTEIHFSHAFESGQEPTAPVSDTITAEESEFLWKTLSKIPQPYRETLVLFYRQEKSTAQVAAAMETSEASVRQRLTRGRQMLREEIATALERNLARTAPNAQFTSQVVAALPALAAQTAGLSATAKSAATVKGGAIMTLLIAWVAPIGLFFGLIFGTIQDIRQSKTPRQRRVAKWQNAVMWIIMIAYSIGLNFAVRIAVASHWDLASQTNLYTIISALFAMSLFGWCVFSRWAMVRVLREDGISEPPFPKLAIWQRFVFTFPVVAICLGWLVRLALAAGDQTTVHLIAAAILVEGFYFAWRLPQLQPHDPIQQMFETFALALLVIFVTINLRLRDWIATAQHLDTSLMPSVFPLWTINAAIAILFTWIVGLTLLSRITNRAVA